MQLIRARQALLPDGWAQDVRVVVGDDGRIERVAAGAPADDEPTDGERGAPARGDTVHERSLLLPAPANLHGHAFQRAMAGLAERRGPDPSDSFWTWRRLMYRFLDRLDPDDVEAIAAFVQLEMLEAGYAAGVEFHYLHHRPGGRSYDDPAELAGRIVAAADTSGIGLTLLPVHYERGGCDGRPLEGGQRRFGNDLDAFEALWSRAGDALGALPPDARLGVAPHSLRAVSPASLSALQGLAPDAPFHMHLAEQVAEADEVRAALGARPVAWLLDNAAVDARWCLIHCTQMEPAETAGLAASGAVAGLCPVTESSLGDGTFDGVAYLGAGGRIGIGSDSNVRIGLAEELRTLEYTQRLRDRSRAALASPEHSTGRRLYDAAVAGGARAAGRDSGRIEAGCLADLVALDADAIDLAGRSGDALLDGFVFAAGDRAVTDVWSAGRHLVAGGRHVAREPIVARYAATAKRLAEAL